MRISDWSSDVCSSDLLDRVAGEEVHHVEGLREPEEVLVVALVAGPPAAVEVGGVGRRGDRPEGDVAPADRQVVGRSEEHTSELQSLMRISYAVFCLKKKKHHKQEYSGTLHHRTLRYNH